MRSFKNWFWFREIFVLFGLWSVFISSGQSSVCVCSGTYTASAEHPTAHVTWLTCCRWPWNDLGSVWLSSLLLSLLSLRQDMWLMAQPVLSTQQTMSPDWLVVDDLEMTLAQCAIVLVAGVNVSVLPATSSSVTSTTVSTFAVSASSSSSFNRCYWPTLYRCLFFHMLQMLLAHPV